jgi:hypothetical protein
VAAQVLLDHGVQEPVVVGVEGTMLQEELAQGHVFVQHPGVHGRHQLVAVDEVHLQGQDAKQEVAVGQGGHGV